MILCYLGLGSNLKSPERTLNQAIQAIKKMPKSVLLQVSPLVFTKPWGVIAQPPFCNAVLAIKTTLPPHQLLLHCQQLERQFGRVRKKRWGPRTLDIDILLYGQHILNTSQLTLPHPHLLARDFVLTPLKALAKSPLSKIVPGLSVK